MASRNDLIPVRDKILQGALDAICQYHIGGTTIRRIVAKAHVSPSLVHYYFPTKRDVFLALFDYLNAFYSKNHASYVHNHSIRPYEKLMIMVNNQIEYTSRRKEYFVIFDFWTHGITDEEIRTKVNEMFAEWENWIRLIIQEGIQAGDFDEKNAEFVPHYLISLILGAAMQYLPNEQAFDLHDYYNRTYRLVEKLLVPPQTAKPETVASPLDKA